MAARRKTKLQTTHFIERLTCSLISLLLIISSLMIAGLSGGVSAHAAAETVTKYEQRNVMDDLNGATVDGEGIDLTLYNFDEHKNVQILSFVEFCYSYQKEKQTEYGLYVYVYNPRGYDWTKNEQLNKIQLRTGGNSSGSFSKYPLKYLNRSESAGYEGLFYKFKIELTEAQKSTVLGSLNSTERIYEVGEIELYNTGVNATAYDVSNTYKYKGYAEGYGSESSEGDTLTCTSDGLLTLTLDVHATQYRPEGTNGKNNYTQDMLHSVYFSIPNKILDEYGGLSAVQAEWLNVTTAPIFVTGNETIYSAMYDSVWKNNGLPTSDLDYCLLANGRDIGIDGEEYIGDFCYHDYKNPKYSVFGNYGSMIVTPDIGNLRYLFYAENGDADNFTLKSADILKYLEDYTNKALITEGTDSSTGDGFGGGGGSGRTAQELVNGKYSSVLFSEVDEDFTVINVHADDKYNLRSETLTQSFWEKVFNLPGTVVESSILLRDIEAIHEVKASDFKSQKAATCSGLYIDEADYDEFKQYYDTAKAQSETVFLFRYYHSEYECREATEFKYATHWGIANAYIDKLDTNAYFAQEVLNLDFDIIDVTCSKGEIDTVIPVIMSPIEIIPGVTPPVITTPENPIKGKRNWWKIVIAALSVIFILFILAATGLLELIGKAIAWIVCLPFRLIGGLFKKNE